MPEIGKEIYSASCNPTRRAKRALIVGSFPTPSAHHPQPRAILPMRPYHPREIITTTDPVVPPPPPAKRGRKPGPLSRTAREAQRRLNHSIIEKARRTKINDALATLRQLVPVDYGYPKVQPSDDQEEEEEDDDDEYEDNEKKSKPKGKGTGKREEKEKEFKLEILVRTVSFLQDLLKRVDVLESTVPACSNCNDRIDTGKKRKRSQTMGNEDHNDAVDQEPRNATVRRRLEEPPLQSAGSNDGPMVSATNNVPDNPTQSHAYVYPALVADARLPSISSWLPNSVIDPSLLPPQPKHPLPNNHNSTNANIASYLPSPPSSTHFDPIRTSQIPPVLNLGPVATAAMVNSIRTPEDESAASLLLQIASSPPFRPVTSSSTASYGLPDPSSFVLHSDTRTQREGNMRQAQTPASLLGLHQGRKYYS
ncbi:hypothetical protein B0H34DRAFT_784357 [Crassisporium funariophilum]|nr:hypothetical protein B0H34DRAFT_784357 [Crassisporium funariophilum]